MRYVLDTTAFSAAMGRDESLFEFLRRRAPGDIATVPPVVAEIEFGIERLDHSSRQYHLLIGERDRLLNVIHVLPWTPEASSSFGRIKADLEKHGKLIDDFDIVIGAIALAHGCSVITSNLKHFQRIKGLRTASWKGEAIRRP
ncbi:MAG: type II toxin-antitoxin system VapC family toxin [Deltaproteobacteria bacterium]|nr:type II toxin-antitoxin system VapC family toxin [Deltaproteobacteria bacterium]